MSKVSGLTVSPSGVTAVVFSKWHYGRQSL